MPSHLTKWFLTAGVSLALAGAYLTIRTFLAGPLPATPPQSALPLATRAIDDEPLPAFRLTRARGSFTQANLDGKWTFLFFGYTQCPDVCPTSLATMQRVVRSARAMALPVPQVVFVSVDPRRDTPELLDQFVPAFDASFVGVSGDDAALEPLARTLGVKFMRHDGVDQRTYTVDHTAHLYLIGPDRRVRSVFPYPHRDDAVVQEYARLVGR